MEAFFLQKRFLLLNIKPDLALKEENFDLKQEIQRKDELLRKHFDKIDAWRNLLQLQDGGSIPARPPGADQRLMGPQSGGPSGQPGMPPGPGGPMMGLPPNQGPMMQQIPVQQPMQNPQMFGMQQSPLRPNFNQGPLDYLMKTTNNIDQVGMNDGRR